jgi:carbonic anhydrase
MSIEELIDGYRRFRHTSFPVAQEVYRGLEKRGQTPQTMFIACCDSRVDPATIFDTSPGELFVLRNVANLVPPNSPMAKHQAMSAALEFAVLHLNVRHIVVMGHAQCGGAKILLEGDYGRIANAEFLGSWMDLAIPARNRMLLQPQARQDSLRYLEYSIVQLSLENLLTYDWIRARFERGEIELHGLHFGIATGELAILDKETGCFVTVSGGDEP